MISVTPIVIIIIVLVALIAIIIFLATGGETAQEAIIRYKIQQCCFAYNANDCDLNTICDTESGEIMGEYMNQLRLNETQIDLICNCED